MHRLAPEVKLGLLTNAEPGGLPPEELGAFAEISIQPRSEMGAWLQGRTDVQGVAVDTAVIDGLEAVAAPLALVLRETPRNRQDRFALPQERRWDQVLVPNPRDHWMPDPKLVPARTYRPVGWIYRTTSQVTQRRDRPSVLIATGGGGTEETATAVRAILDPVIAKARELARNGFDVVQALGPRAPVGGRLSHVDEILNPGGDLNGHFAHADLVISTAGYNSVLELAALDVPTMLVAIPRSIDDQEARARLWGARLGCYLDADANDAAEWLARTAMLRQRRQPWDLGLSGAEPAARLMLDLVS